MPLKEELLTYISQENGVFHAIQDRVCRQGKGSTRFGWEARAGEEILSSNLFFGVFVGKAGRAG